QGAEQAEHQPARQRRRAGRRRQSTVRTTEHQQRRPERGEHPLHGGDAGADWAAGPVAGGAGVTGVAGRTEVSTAASTDRPGSRRPISSFWRAWPASMRILTGTRWAILVKLPTARSGGSSDPS